jgi:DNA-binding NarL/FixJ family response regulator
MKRTVVIVDDHAGFRRFARRLLEADGFAVVGEAADGTSAIALIRAMRPELVLVDVLLPDFDGFSVADRLACLPDQPVVILTSSRDAADFATRLARTPAKAFVPKRELSGPALIAAIEGG